MRPASNLAREEIRYRAGPRMPAPPLDEDEFPPPQTLRVGRPLVVLGAVAALAFAAWSGFMLLAAA